MTFLIILISVLIERFWTKIASARSWRWLSRYASWIERAILKGNSGGQYIAYFLVVVPILIVLLIIESILGSFAYHAWMYVFNFIVLLYCLGPKSFYEPLEAKSQVHLDEATEADEAGEQEDASAAAQIVEVFDVHAASLKANCWVFAPLFWFAILGPFGAVLYRITDQLLETDFLVSAKAVLDWIPVRLLSFSIALVSYFVEVFPVWLKYLVRGLKSNASILQACLEGALKEEKNATHLLALLDRAFIVWLVVLALVVLL